MSENCEESDLEHDWEEGSFQTEDGNTWQRQCRRCGALEAEE